MFKDEGELERLTNRAIASLFSLFLCAMSVVSWMAMSVRTHYQLVKYSRSVSGLGLQTMMLCLPPERQFHM